MPWTLDSDRPIWAQLVERLKTQIVSGYYPPGSRLPTVRDLAAQASVNPNTMQKAFTELERTGLVVTMRTSGRIVTQDTGRILQARAELASEQLEQFWEQMGRLGFSQEEIWTLLNQKKEKEGGHGHE